MSNGGSAVQIQVTGAADGRFDSGDLVIFYAEAYTGRYMTQNVYWLTYGAAQAPADCRMSTRAATPANPPLITTIMQTVHVEVNTGVLQQLSAADRRRSLVRRRPNVTTQHPGHTRLQPDPG